MRKQTPELLNENSRESFLRRKIESQGLTLKAFAEQIGIPPSSLGTILKRGIHRTSLDVVVKICDALDLDLNDLSLSPKSSKQRDPFFSMIPPWVKFPTVSANSAVWLKDEILTSYLDEFKLWWSILNEEERASYFSVYSPPQSWGEFFCNITEPGS